MGPRCCSASLFDSSELKGINAFLRRSACNLRTEQQTANDVVSVSRDKLHIRPLPHCARRSRVFSRKCPSRSLSQERSPAGTFASNASATSSSLPSAFARRFSAAFVNGLCFVAGMPAMAPRCATTLSPTRRPEIRREATLRCPSPRYHRGCPDGRHGRCLRIKTASIAPVGVFCSLGVDGARSCLRPSVTVAKTITYSLSGRRFHMADRATSKPGAWCDDPGTGVFGPHFDRLAPPSGPPGAFGDSATNASDLLLITRWDGHGFPHPAPDSSLDRC